MIVLKIITFVIIVILLFYIITKVFFPIVEICGDSMYPTYAEGEHIITTKIFSRKHIKLNDVLVFKPRDDDRLVIKRVSRMKYKNKNMEIESIYFLGDNSETSFDSRNYGYVSINKVEFKVIAPRSKVLFKNNINF